MAKDTLPRLRAPRVDPPFRIVLVEPEIHWNTGNAGRTCLAVGAQLHLVCPLGFSLDEKEVRRAGLDYWARVNPTVWPSWADFERTLPSLGAPLFFTTRSPRHFQQIAYPRPAVLIFGRESVGLPADLLARHPAETVAIPIRSLNLSTSVALAAYEARRQWG